MQFRRGPPRRLGAGARSLILLVVLAAPFPAGSAHTGVPLGESYGDPKGYATQEWFRFALQGDAEAQFNIGVLYEKGHEIPPDYSDAARWYRKAADQGHDKAQFNLGLLYARGTGVALNFAEAAQLFRRAADGGSGRAMLNLALFYETGKGIPRDVAAAHLWYGLAALHLPPRERQLAVAHRDDLANNATPAQRAEAEQRIRAWKAKRQEK